MNKVARCTFIILITTLIAGCSSAQTSSKLLIISALPDQKPEILQPLYTNLANYLQQKLGVPVQYQAVSTYTEAIDGFHLGKLDLVWFGGLTGVEAQLQVNGAQAIAQRDIDANFQSVFIANVSSGLQPFTDLKGLTALKGHSFTFGSNSSTSGFLMPEYFLGQAGVHDADFRSPPYFSGSHDNTISLVQSGQYEVGALNSQIWDSRTKDGTVDPTKVIVLWKSPPFFDNHWVIRPDVTQRYGADFIQRVENAFFSLDSSVPDQAKILTGFAATKFIATKNDNYAAIEAIARQIGDVQE